MAALGEVKIDVVPKLDLKAFAVGLRTLADQVDPEGLTVGKESYRTLYETAVEQRAEWRDAYERAAKRGNKLQVEVESLKETLALEVAASRENAKLYLNEQVRRIAAEKAARLAGIGQELERQRSKQMGEAFMHLHDLAKAVVGPKQ